MAKNKKKIISEEKKLQVTDFCLEKLTRISIVCSFFNKNKPCLILALFIKEQKNYTLVGGYEEMLTSCLRWVLRNADIC